MMISRIAEVAFVALSKALALLSWKFFCADVLQMRLAPRALSATLLAVATGAGGVARSEEAVTTDETARSRSADYNGERRPTTPLVLSCCV